MLWAGIAMLLAGLAILAYVTYRPMSGEYWDALDEFFAESHLFGLVTIGCVLAGIGAVATFAGAILRIA